MKKLALLSIAIFIANLVCAQAPLSTTGPATGINEYDAAFTGSIEVSSWDSTFAVLRVSTDGNNWDTVVGPAFVSNTPNPVPYSVADALVGVFMPSTQYYAEYRSFVVTSTDTIYDSSHNTIMFTTLDEPGISLPDTLIQISASLYDANAEYSWNSGGNVLSDHRFEYGIVQGDYTYGTFTNQYSNDGTDVVGFGPVPASADTIYVRVKTFNQAPIPSSDWKEFILVTQTPQSPMIVSNVANPNFGLPSEMQGEVSWTIGTSFQGATLNIELMDVSGNVLDSDVQTVNADDTYTVNFNQGLPHPGNLPRLLVATISDPAFQFVHSDTVAFSSEEYVDPSVSSVVPNETLGGPSEVGVVTNFDLGDSPSANLIVSLWDATDSTLISTTGPMLQSAPASLNVSVLSGYAYPGGVASYATAELLDPSTMAGDTLASSNFTSELFADLTFGVSVSPTYGALDEALIEVTVMDTGDCTPATAVWSLSVEGSIIANAITPLVLDSIGLFTDVVNTPSGDTCLLSLTVTDNCGNSNTISVEFVSEVIPGLSVSAAASSAGLNNQDQKNINISYSLGTFNDGILTTETFTAPPGNVFVSSTTPQNVSGSNVITEIVTGLNPSGQSGVNSYYTVVILTDLSGQNSDTTVVYYDSDDVYQATGSVVTITPTQSEIFTECDIDPQGQWAQSVTSSWVTWNPVIGNSVTSNVVSGITAFETVPHNFYDLRGGRTGVLEFWVQNGGGTLMYYSETVQTQAPTPAEAYVSADTVNGGYYAELVIVIHGRGAWQNVTVSDIVDGQPATIPYTTLVGSSTDTLVLLRGPFNDCETVQFDVRIENEEDQEAGYVYNNLASITTPCSASIEEEFWAETQMVTLNPEYIQLPQQVFAKVQIIDLSSRVVDEVSGTGRLDFSSINTPGMYIVSVVTDKGNFSQKVLMR